MPYRNLLSRLGEECSVKTRCNNDDGLKTDLKIYSLSMDLQFIVMLEYDIKR